MSKKKAVDNSAKPVVDAEVVKLTLPEQIAPEPVRVIFEFLALGWDVYVTGQGGVAPGDPVISDPHDAIHAFLAACRSTQRVIQNCSAHDATEMPDGRIKINVGVHPTMPDGVSLDSLIGDAIERVNKEHGE